MHERALEDRDSLSDRLKTLLDDRLKQTYILHCLVFSTFKSIYYDLKSDLAN